MYRLVIIISLLLPVLSVAQQIQMPELQGWSKTGETLIFDRDNLFEHINGASEFYFSYNFRKLYVTSYEKEGSELSIEIYDQGDEINAYGIYSMEKSPNAETKNIGLEGYFDSATLNFTTGRYYVKMMAYNIDNAGAGILSDVANSIAPTLCETPEMPTVINAMPVENLIANSRQYIPSNFMGLSFLGAAYRAKYSSSDGEYTLFVIERESPEDIESIIKKYHEFSDTKLRKLKEGTFLIEDPFNGTINLKWSGKYLIGASGKITKSLLSGNFNKLENALNVK